MPTGYTSKIAEGISFEEFALDCARAFGALIEMRDMPSSTPIPKKFEPSDYHLKELEESKRELKALKQLPPKKCYERSLKEYNESIKEQERMIKNKKELEVKYIAMLQKIESYVPPTKDHVNLKNFMKEQVECCIKHDCSIEYYERALKETKLLSGEDWKKQRIEFAQRDVDYHEKGYSAEVEKTKKTNEWVEQLRKSLENYE